MMSVPASFPGVRSANVWILGVILLASAMVVTAEDDAQSGPGWKAVRITSPGPFVLDITLDANSGAVLVAALFNSDGIALPTMLNGWTSGGIHARVEDASLGIDVSIEREGGGGGVHSSKNFNGPAQDWTVIFYASGGVTSWDFGFSPNVAVETIGSGHRTFYADGPEFTSEQSAELTLGRQTRYASGSRMDFTIDGHFIGIVGLRSSDRTTVNETISLAGPMGEIGCPCMPLALRDWGRGDYSVQWDGLSHTRGRYIVVMGADVTI